MSVYGGDSWGREAQHRKRRVDDLLLDAAGHHSTSYQKLPSGKYACLVCPHNPVLDTPLMLSMHMKASRHCAAEAKVKQREQERQREISKRIALSQDSNSTTKFGSNICSKPLIEKTRRTALEALHHASHEHSTVTNTNTIKSSWPVSMSAPSDTTSRALAQMESSGKDKDIVQIPSVFRERREKELKFTAAGWKRDGRGGWFRDENAEFDSDEEDPNVSLGCGE